MVLADEADWLSVELEGPFPAQLTCDTLMQYLKVYLSVYAGSSNAFRSWDFSKHSFTLSYSSF